MTSIRNMPRTGAAFPVTRPRSWANTTVRLVGTTVILGSVVWFVPVSEIVRTLAAVKLGYVAAGIALSLLAAAIDSNQLWLLLRRLGLPISLWKVFETKMVSCFYGQFLAGDLIGFAVKIYRLTGRTRNWLQVVVGMAFVRLVHTLTLILMGLVFVVMARPEGAGRWAAVILMTMAAMLVALQLSLASGAIERLLGLRLPGRLGAALAEKVQAHGRAAIESYRLFGDMFWSTSLQAVVRHTLGMASFACLTMSLDIHLSWLTIGWSRVILEVVMMLPISLSGLGLREGTLVILLRDYAVPAQAAAALAFLIFLVRVMENSLGGLLEARSFLLPGRTVDGPA